MAGPIRTRQSCDRCHAQKLKCPKQAGSAVCTRCMRAGAVCIFSPPGGTTTGRATAVPGGLGHEPTGCRPGPPPSCASILAAQPTPPLDWSFLQPDFAFVDPGTQPYLPLDSNFGQAESDSTAAATACLDAPCGREEGDMCSSHGPGPVSPASRADCTQQLSKIIRDLDAATSSLRPNGQLHFGLDEDPIKKAAEVADEYPHGQVLEALFGATQRLIDLYPEAVQLSLARGPAREPRCESENCMHSTELPPSLRALEQSVLLWISPSAIDHSLANMLISCHLRLLDVLDHLFMLVVSCFRYHLAFPAVQGRDPDFCIPQLRLGSYTLPPSSSAMMQISLLKHLTEILSERATTFSRDVASAIGEGQDKESRALALQCEALRERQAARADHITAIGEELVKRRMIKF